MNTTARTQTCGHCGATLPIADLNLSYTFGDVAVECKDRDTCKQRGAAHLSRERVKATGHDDECESTFDHGGWGWTRCDCAARIADLEDGDED
jgi:hypothetical protein